MPVTPATSMKSASLVPSMLIGRNSTSPLSCSTGLRMTPISLPSATLPVMISSSDFAVRTDVGREAEVARHVAIDGQRAEVGAGRDSGAAASASAAGPMMKSSRASISP